MILGMMESFKIAMLLIIGFLFIFKCLVSQPPQFSRSYTITATSDDQVLQILDGLNGANQLETKKIESPKLPIFYKYSPPRNICGMIFSDPLLAKAINKKPFTVKSETVDSELSSSCENIRQRGTYPANSRTEIEKNFPIAFVRIVYKAYHIQELLFNLIYAPQNLYCYALDSTSSALFHEHMRNFSDCFPNVILTNTEYDVDAAGHNMTRSYLECLHILREIPFWKYAILLQNDDIPIKSNYEMVQILSALNGSNDINVGRPFPHRLPKHANWSYAALRLFKDETKNRAERWLQIAKGSASVSLSRSFVEFIVTKLHLNKLIELFDSKSYGTDEMLFHSIHSDDSLDAPGGFTRKCIDNQSGFITRYVIWPRSRRLCQSQRYRHSICILGTADLDKLRETPEMFANKMLSESDYGAIACWAQYLAERTFSNSTTIDITTYRKSQIVRFNNNKAFWRKNMSLFEC